MDELSGFSLGCKQEKMLEIPLHVQLSHPGLELLVVRAYTLVLIFPTISLMYSGTYPGQMDEFSGFLLGYEHEKMLEIPLHVQLS